MRSQRGRYRLLALLRMEDRLPGVGQHGLARGRQAHAAGAAHEQGAAHLVFELAYRYRQWRLGHVHAFGGLVEIAGFGQCDELLELAQVHFDTI